MIKKIKIAKTYVLYVFSGHKTHSIVPQDPKDFMWASYIYTQELLSEKPAGLFQESRILIETKFCTGDDSPKLSILTLMPTWLRNSFNAGVNFTGVISRRHL